MLSVDHKNSLDIFIPSIEFKSMLLDKFCVKKHFEIGLVNTLTAKDEAFLNDLVALNKLKEDITHVAFIESTDVLTFIRSSFSGPKENHPFPPFLVEELKEFSQYNDDCHLEGFGLINDASSIKFKLIQTMYQQFCDEVKERKKQELLNKELSTLAEKRPIGSRDKRSKRSNKSNIGSKSKQSTANSKQKSREKVEVADCIDYGLEESDLIVDDILKEQVYFYILKGYNDIKLVNELSKMQVKVSFIIQISEHEPVDEIPLNPFWKDIDLVRSNPQDFLQNVALLKYRPPLNNRNSQSLEINLKRVVDIVKGLIDLKRMHFNYVKNLLLLNTKFTEIARTFPIYQNMMDIYPMETLTIPLIVDAIVEEVHLSGKKHAVCKKPNTCHFYRERPPCPFDFFPKARRSNKVDKNTPFFKVYEEDYLNLVFNSYKVGYQYMANNLRVLKLQMPVQLAMKCEFDEDIDDYLTHRHEVHVPNSNKQSVLTNDQTQYLINLLYLKKSILRKSSRLYAVFNEFTQNLIIDDSKKYLEDSLPKYVNTNDGNFCETFEGMNCGPKNVYQSLQPLSLHWAEVLKPELLLQYLLDSQLKYLYADYIACDLTNTLMIRFHNNVDSFGLHTKVWKEYLRTPIALADFCKFVLVDDYEWLKQHLPYSQITYVDIVRRFEEETPMRLSNDVLYSAYKHLLMPQIQPSVLTLPRINECPCVDDTTGHTPSRENALYDQSESLANLKEILLDLEKYNKTVDFSEHCQRCCDRCYRFPAYGLGSTKFRITGYTTTFISLDDVSVTVDSSRLCTESFKLNLKVSSDDNLFVLYTNQKSFNFHFVLADGSVIFCAKPSTEDTSENTGTNCSLTEFTNKEKNCSVQSEASPLIDASNEEEEERTIISMDFNHYSSLQLYPIVGNIIRETPEELYKKDVEKEIDILERLQRKQSCIKVSRRGNFEHLDEIVTEKSIPVSSVVRRIIEKERLCRTPKRKCVTLGKLPPKKLNSSFDYVITIPNGLTVKILPDEDDNKSYVIKQSYQHAAGPGIVSEEKYRLFTKDGNIIIRKLDGTIKILTSSGKEIRFEKISNTTGEEVNCKSRKKLDNDLVRKLLARLMSNHPDHEDSDLYPSRRGHLKTKSKSVSHCPKLVELSKLPFSTISLITLNGYKLVLKDNKLSKVACSRLISEVNFLTEEKRHKREDGFSSTTDRDGCHVVTFTDGTSIKTTVFVQDELVRVNEKDKMGWVLIKVTFSYEHPFYKPVYFDNVSDVVKIRLNEHQSLDVMEGGARLDMKNSWWDMKTDSIGFTKTCDQCKSQYNCQIFTEPLYQNRTPNDEENFVTATDSYDKTFKADFSGNCKVFPNYIKGVLNKNGCNHAVTTENQKIYSIKKDLSGMLLCNDLKFSSIINEKHENKILQCNANSKNAILMVTITKNLCTKFNERFFGKIIKQFETFKEMLPTHRPVLYHVIRKLYNMVEMSQIEGLVKCLKNLFPEEEEEDMVRSKNAQEFLQKHNIQSHSSIYTMTGEEQKATKSSLSVHEKILILNKKCLEAKKLMQTPLPNYFRSPLCTFVPPS